MGGYYLMHRGWMNHPVFRAAPLTEREGWLWLIEEAAYSDRRFRMGTLIVNLRRGQLVTSYRFLAKAWKWNRSRTQRFLRRLETETMIETTTDTHCTVITICNYDVYQTMTKKYETVSETLTETKQKKDKEGKERKGGKEDISITAADELLDVPDFLSRKPKRELEAQFEEWWPLVPRKVGKGAARTKFMAALKKADFETLKAGIMRYAEEAMDKEPQFIAHPATWLHQERWLDEEVLMARRGDQTLNDAFANMDRMVKGSEL